MNESACNENMATAIEETAQDILQIPTLERRGRDGLDFHELSVWQIKRALHAAYEAGFLDGRLFQKRVLN